MARLQLIIILCALISPNFVSAKISEKQAANNVNEFYNALEYTVTEGDINTDHDIKAKWINLTTEGARLPNEPKNLNFLWNLGSGGNAEFMIPTYYFDCYAKARDIINEYKYRLETKVVAARKPDLATAMTFDVDYYHIKVSKHLKIKGHSVEIQDEVFVKAENGHISYVRNIYGGEIPNVITNADVGNDAIADADYQFTIGNHAKSYELYKKAVASSMLAKLDEADASYRLAILLYYFPKKCEPNAKRKEINRLISAYLSHAREIGSWYIKDKADKAKYYMEN